MLVQVLDATRLIQRSAIAFPFGPGIHRGRRAARQRTHAEAPRLFSVSVWASHLDQAVPSQQARALGDLLPPIVHTVLG